MKRIYLPLHVWDREFDSRLVIAYLEACKGNTAILGHEYNMAPLYGVDEGAILFKAGAPLDHTTRGKWHKLITENGGVVLTQDEEGINNMPFIFRQNNGSRSANLNIEKIRERPNSSGVQAFKDVKFQLAWSDLHRACQCHQVESIESRSIAINKILSASSVRFDLTGELGKLLQSRLTQAIHNIYQNYILILDNFSVDHRGQKGLIDPSRDLRENGWSDQRINKYKQELQRNRAIESESRSDFLKLIQELATENPDINFVFRPHPVLDKLFWHTGLGSFKNISIVESGSVHAWIYGATATIHSGCTTGLEALAADIPTLDVSSLISPRTSSIQASLIGQAANKQLNHTDAKKAIRTLWKRKHSTSPLITESILNKSDIEPFSSFQGTNPEDHALEILEINSQIVAHRIQKHLNLINGDQVIGSKSALSTILKISSQSKNSKLGEINGAIISKNILNQGPNLGKSRFVSLKEVEARVNDIKLAFYALGIELKPIRVGKIGINTFLIDKDPAS